MVDAKKVLLLLSLLQLWIVFVVGRCPPVCINGQCTDGQTCECHGNFEGSDCSIPVQHCPDGKRSCWNGSECVRNNERDPVTKKYHYHCDCSKAYGVSAFAGLQCEHSSTVSCERNKDKVSEYSFCTNGGECIHEVSNGRQHAGCICPPDFEGDHCQYTKGLDFEKESLETLGTYTGPDNGLSGVAIAFIVLASLGGAAVFGVYIWRVMQRRREAKEPPTAEDLQIDHGEDVSPPHDVDKREII